MLERAIHYYKLINRPGKAEDSKSFRVAVLIAVLISVFAAVSNEAVGIGVGIPVMAGVILGSYFSWKYRRRPNLLLKFFLTILLLVVFAFFWTELSSSIFDVRYPLVRLFLWLQVLHSFDLPTRRDLDFSLISATILMAFAGSLSTSTSFIYLLVSFFVVSLFALCSGHISYLRSSVQVFAQSKGRTKTKAVAFLSILMIPIALAFFVTLPRLPGFSGYLPFSYLKGKPGSFEGLIRNPGYSRIPEGFPSKPLPFNPKQYAGFSRFLDLRMRGVPDDVILMKVRSDHPSYWRGTAFDKFIGKGWINTETKYEDVYSNELPITVTYPAERERYPVRELVQTFFIERKMPNMIFAAYFPRDIFFPTRIVKVDSLMTVLTPDILSPGLIYTVVSEVSSATPEMLRSAGKIATHKLPEDIKKRYLQLPQISPEIIKLANEIVKDVFSDYDRLIRLSTYLKDNYSYELVPPRQGNEENSLEFFLFRAKRGNCEQFATAMAVMARVLGIPSRVAVGFDTGTFNPLTGYYEVSARDAHAWVEAYFPVYGWITFEPTPGWSRPEAFSGRTNTWSGFAFFKFIGRALGKVIPSRWLRGFTGAIGVLGRAIAEATGGIAGVILKHWKGIILVTIITSLLGFFFLLKRLRRKEVIEMDELSVIFMRLVKALEEIGFPRKPSQTALEFTSLAGEAFEIKEIREVGEIFTRARYSKGEPSLSDTARLKRITDEVYNKLKGELRHKRFGKTNKRFSAGEN